MRERGREAGCCAWHPSLLFLLPPLPEHFSFSPQSRQPATQFTPLLISLALPRLCLPRQLGEGPGQQHHDGLEHGAAGRRRVPLCRHVDTSPEAPDACADQDSPDSAVLPNISLLQGSDGQNDPAQPCLRLLGPCGAEPEGCGEWEKVHTGAQREHWVGQPWEPTPPSQIRLPSSRAPLHPCESQSLSAVSALKDLEPCPAPTRRRTLLTYYPAAGRLRGADGAVEPGTWEPEEAGRAGGEGQVGR